MQYKRRGLAATATLTLLALGAAACGGSSGGSNGSGTGADKGPTGSISIVGSEPQNPLVSVNTNETGGGNVLDALSTGLVNYNNDTGAPEDAVAESIETTDNTLYTIKIKKGLKFHDDTEVKAKNFVDAWNYGAYGPNAALNSYFFETIDGFTDVQGVDKNKDEKITADEAPIKEMKGLKVVDDYTFTVQLSSPASSFPVRLGYTAFVPLPDVVLHRPDRVRREAGLQRPLQVRLVGPRPEHQARREHRLHPRGQAHGGRGQLQDLPEPGRGLRGPAGEQRRHHADAPDLLARG